MTRAQVRAFLKSGADAVKAHFDSGRLTEFNSVKDKGFPFVWVESPAAATEFGGSGASLNDDWDIKIHISKIDRADSIQDEYEALVDDCDLIATKLIWQYNYVLQSAPNVTTANQNLYKLVTMSSIKRDPFIKKHADCLTGIILSFSLNTPNLTDVCP